MSLLSDGELTSMRVALNGSLPDTAVIQVASITDDLGGGGTASWSNAGTVACRVASMGAATASVRSANRLDESANWLITLPALTTVDVDDRIVSGGRTFDVRAIRAPASWEIGRRVEAHEVN